MNGNTVHEGKRTLLTRSMIELAVMALQLQSYCAMLYSGNKLAVRLMTRKQ